MESLIGKTIDNYRILEVIGRGGMGVVFKAIDTNLEKTVALKMIDPFLAEDENFVRRFKTEAKALAKLENPNIVSVHALRETDKGLFMVMEYVDAKPLSKHLADNGPLSIKDIIAVSKQLLNAIGHAHEFGIIHRDIKPSNILLCYDGKIKVTDFGLAKVIQQKGPASTVTQARAGTLYYMSPEQVKGLKNVDTRSDIYSLGMTIYEMTAGRVPFEKTDSDFTIQKQIVEGELPSPVKFNESIPKKLTKIILKAIDKDPDKRYQTAEEMLEDFRNFEKKTSYEQDEIKKISEPKEKREKKFIFKKNILPKIAAFYDFLKISLQKIISYPMKFLGAISKKPVILFTLVAMIFFVILYILFSNEIGSVFSSLFNRKPVQEVVVEDDISSSESQIEDSELLPESLLVTDASGKKLDRLYVETIPAEANIFLDGKPFGKSNRFIDSLEIKTYRLLLKSKNYNDVDMTLDLSKNNSISLTLVPKNKSMINSSPEGADLLIDGVSFGKTPLTSIEAITPGTHRISFSKTGFKTFEAEIIVKDDKSFQPVFKKLDPITAKIEISVQPGGSKLYVDNNEKRPINNKSPLRFVETLSVGKKHTIKVRNSKLNVEVTRIVPVEDESTINYDFDLSKKFNLIINLYPATSNKLKIKGPGVSKSYDNINKCDLVLKPGEYNVIFTARGVTKDTTYTVSDKFYEMGTKTEVALPLYILEEVKDTTSQ
jgi:serine/threonine protein kinase